MLCVSKSKKQSRAVCGNEKTLLVPYQKMQAGYGIPWSSFRRKMAAVIVCGQELLLIQKHRFVIPLFCKFKKFLRQKLSVGGHQKLTVV